MNSYEPIPAETERIANAVVDAAMKVHRTLGPGLLESVYEACLCCELEQRGIPFKAQISLPVVYEDVRLDAGLRLDLLVDNAVIAELKAVQEMQPVFEAQLLTYLRLTGLRLGLLINFNVPLLKNGIKRVIL
ncbi:MAG: GxxExxY protein [Candidatus Coatesbacteria bacterium]|nr:GxxExxY protein [Candidatus Coatesbacteria bacterium]